MGTGTSNCNRLRLVSSALITAQLFILRLVSVRILPKKREKKQSPRMRREISIGWLEIQLRIPPWNLGYSRENVHDSRNLRSLRERSRDSREWSRINRDAEIHDARQHPRARARRKAETQSTIQQYRRCRSSTSRRWRKAVFMESRRSPGWSMHTRARMESFVESYVGWKACEYWIHCAWTRWPRNRGKRMEFLVDSSLRASLLYNSFFAPMFVRWERMIPPLKRWYPARLFA